MRWDAKITDTAKISVEVRWILIDRIDSILDKLTLLRQRALKYASLEAVGTLASQIPLPPPSSTESEELGEISGSCSEAFQLLPRVVVDEGNESTLEVWLSRQQGKTCDKAGQDGFSGLEGTWFERLDTSAEDIELLDPLLYWDSVFQATEDLDDTQDETSEHIEQDLEDNTSGDFDGNESRTHLLPEPDTTYSNRGLEASHNDQLRHPLLTPWRETSPFKLQRYLNEAEKAEEIALSHIDLYEHLFSQGGDTQVDVSLKSLEREDGGIESIQCVTRELLQYLQNDYSATYTVDGNQLIELQTYVEHVSRFRAYLVQSLREVRNSLNRREERYRMREANGSIELMMKSRGEASPLAMATSVDENWEEEDEWSSTPVMRKAGYMTLQTVGYKPDRVKW